ncbi:large proline-rich protein bag6-A-like isoform X2 [Carica papaya]|uniref:large proline-rich protein bag6-A-like isoform X2 n=1 Tax=Carica papaya TaxID=3649 RepID=UPI000B8C79D5|nr:large proline-rich protein bag6-A-like isoform X2 [Carica papaya]
MGSNSNDKLTKIDDVEGSETTIEIKIKTLDSQTYTLRVDKQVPVPALKEQIASVTGVVSEQQRLICRGKVLKDDQLLSAYHVEDGHTLHLVVRQPVPLSYDGHPSHSVNDTAPGADLRHGVQVSPSVVIETFNLPDQGDGVPPEISRIVSAVLGSFGFSNTGSGGTGFDFREHGPQRGERASGASGVLVSTQPQAEQASMMVQSDRIHSAFTVPSTAPLGPLQPPVIHDSLTTLLQYLGVMRREFDGIVREGGNNAQVATLHGTEGRNPNSMSHSGTVREGLPTPASLAEVMLSTRQMLIEQIGESLLQLARQLEDQAAVTDTSMRTGMQSNAWRSGYLIHNLGAFFLELGRATMTVRLGQTPSEAVVNAGPAVFISPSGPNPLMVQPLSFQHGAGFGTIPMGNVQSNSGSSNGRGSGFLPRRIDIQIRRGLPTSNVNREERGDTQLSSGQRNSSITSAGENRGGQTIPGVLENPSFTGESVRVVPLRTMVAAVPASFSGLPSESSGHSVGLYYPVLGRFQPAASGHIGTERGSQASNEHLSANARPGQQVPQSADQQQISGNRARYGAFPHSDSSYLEPSNPRGASVNVVSAGGTQSSQDPERQIPSSIFQFLRALFPGGEIHVEDPNIHGTAPRSDSGHGVTSDASPEAEPSVTDEGLFLSNLLQQIMPLISQNSGTQQNATEQRMTQDSSTQAENSSAGTSQHHGDFEEGPPNPKRQKTE